MKLHDVIGHAKSSEFSKKNGKYYEKALESDPIEGMVGKEFGITFSKQLTPTNWIFYSLLFIDLDRANPPVSHWSRIEWIAGAKTAYEACTSQGEA